MEFKVATEQFNGPLDLMLHLIKEEKLNLFDLDIQVLTQQYINYLNKLQEIHLEIESEYLKELATLIEFKSKKILPQDKSQLDTEYEEDKQDLVRRLLEYQAFKEVASSLGENYEERNQLFSKVYEIQTEPLNDEIKGDVYDLYKAFNRLLKRININKNMQVKFAKKETSVEEMSLRINQAFANRKDQFSFQELIELSQDIKEAVVSFIVVLDLIRLNIINYTVDSQDEIWLKWGGENA